jgi:cytochrome c-type biogenesis protein CcmF
MTVAHIGLGLAVLSISAVESYTLERDAAMAPGDTLVLGRYAYRFDDIRRTEGPNYEAEQATITVLRDGKPTAVLTPERRYYWVQRQTLTEASISNHWNLDLFAALSSQLGEGRWSVRAQIRPLINYVWYAAGLMFLGGFIAATDRRYRSRVPAAVAEGSESARAEPA